MVMMVTHKVGLQKKRKKKKKEESGDFFPLESCLSHNLQSKIRQFLLISWHSLPLRIQDPDTGGNICWEMLMHSAVILADNLS